MGVSPKRTRRFCQRYPERTVMNRVGCKFRYHYDSGDVIEVHFETESLAHWICVAGQIRGQGGTENYLASNIAPGIELISWVEDNGCVMTLASNFNTMTYVSSIAMPGRPLHHVRLGHGRIEQVDES